jgi:hypothetical protein
MHISNSIPQQWIITEYKLSQPYGPITSQHGVRNGGNAKSEF